MLKYSIQLVQSNGIKILSLAVSRQARSMHESTYIAIRHRVWHALMATPQWKWSTCTRRALIISIICTTAIGEDSCFKAFMASFGSARHSSDIVSLPPMIASQISLHPPPNVAFTLHCLPSWSPRWPHIIHSRGDSLPWGEQYRAIHEAASHWVWRICGRYRQV